MDHLTARPILDMCCGSKMFYHDRNDPRVVFCDVRSESVELCEGRVLTVAPDVVADFRALPFPDARFSLVVFDPPHLLRAGPNSWMRHKYGVLTPDTWPQDIAAGFREAFRVLKPGGSLLFKWNETHIHKSKILALAGRAPLLSQRVGKSDKTHWIVFFKDV